jgi:glycosyltransferase involved in cell wall biosynthesis
MLSALILTFNEEANLAACIASLPWRDDVHVLDSNSADATRTIAETLGARVSVRTFDGYASQRNAGLSLPFKHEWIVMLDADERMTPELAGELEAAIATARPRDAMFRVRRKDMFMDKWLRRSSGYPTWFPRVLRRGRVHVEREINEVYVPDGRVRNLRGHILHYPFNKGVDWWFERHNRYSSAEAELLVRGEAQSGSLAKALSSDPSERRAALKALAYRMPGRPFLVFLYLYLLRGGFLDGAAGHTYATMRMAYELMIDAKAVVARVNAANSSRPQTAQARRDTSSGNPNGEAPIIH